VSERTRLFLELLETRIVLLDGATGTALEGAGLGPDDFGGEAFAGCNEHLVLTRPEAVRRMHDAYLEAGADVVETDTFGATPLVLGEYGLSDRALEINRRAAAIAREACRAHSTPDGPRFVAGSMGPTTRSLTLSGGVDFGALEAHYRVQALGLIEGGADLLLVETIQDTLNARAALVGIQRAFAETERRLPVLLSATLEPGGTLLAGSGAQAFYASVMHADPLAVGLNCSTGPAVLEGPLGALSEAARTRTLCYPNAGLPDRKGRYGLSPEDFAAALRRFALRGWLNLAGGCCGTGPAHIRALREALEGLPPRRVSDHHRVFLSGTDFLEISGENRPVLAGERTNVLGSRSFRRRLREGRLDEAAEVARDQVKAGARLVDVCLQEPGRRERADMEAFLGALLSRVRVPLLIDTTDPEVAEAALRRCPGRGLLNSANLEDGGARLRRMARLARLYGASLVVQTLDDHPSGMAVTAGRKLEAARRAHRLLTEELGMRPEEVFFDPLVFPCATGDGKFRGAARETLEALRRLKAEFPLSPTLLGLSNVSYGLPPAAREVLHAVFFARAAEAGLDVAIANPETLRPASSLDPELRALAEALLFRGEEADLRAFLERFRSAAPSRRRPAPRRQNPEETVRRCVDEGSRRGLEEALEALLQKGEEPLGLLNGLLLSAMDEVGRRFARGEKIVAEVLASAEVVKAAARFLEERLGGETAPARGTVVLATVRGDVHDIGKNLVATLLAHNGYRVVDLGTRVPPEVLAEAVGEHRPLAVGLSGLLVRSAWEMAAAARTLRERGLTGALLLTGGAALDRRFVEEEIAPAYGGPVAYAPTAMEGLFLLNAFARGEAVAMPVRAGGPPPPTPAPRSSPEAPGVEPAEALPPPDEEEHLFPEIAPRLLWPYVDLQRLLGRHLGLRGPVRRLLEGADLRAEALEERCLALVKAVALRPGALYRFFRAQSEGARLRLFPAGGGAVDLSLPPPPGGGLPSLAAYVRPGSRGGGDSVALFLATAGGGVRERAEALRREGNLLEAYLLEALALEMAEAAAEWIHGRIREAWGFPARPEGGRPRGERFAFGYPSCPDLEAQGLLLRLLGAERLGVTLTEGHMMEPEATTAGIVFHHPQARYPETEEGRPEGGGGSP